MARSIWNGCLAVGDLRVPVKLFGAVADKQVRFREVHVKDGASIEHRRVDPKSGREVPYEHVVRGFETGDGEYVVLDDDEVRAADGPNAKVVDVEAFVPAEQVDPVYYEKPYHLGPRDGSEGGYRLLHDALARAERVGIGRIVLRTRERLVALRALGDGLLGLSTLRFADEVVDPESFDLPEPARAPGRRELEMAAALVERLSEPFRAADWEDEHRAALLALVRRKAEGEAIEPPAEEPAEAPDDLAAALDATLEQLARRRRRTRGEHGAGGARRRARGGHAPRRGGRARARSGARARSRRGAGRSGRRRARARRG